MDPPLTTEPGPPPGFSVREKRPVENGGEGESGTQLSKKPRLGTNSERGLRRVAEIVLALSTMAKIRGGRKPTEAEIGLMGEARSKLVELCEGLAPKDIVARDAIGAVIEDLGLNAKLKEQRLGFRGPKLTISDKFLLTKRKMEESKKYAAVEESKKHAAVEESKKHSAHPVTYPSHPPLKASFSAPAETHGMPHTVRIIPADKPNHAPISSGGFPVSSSHHVSAAPPTSQQPQQYQLPTNEVRASAGSSGLPSSHPGRDSMSPAMPRVERVQFRSDGGPNGSSYTVHVHANSSANHPPVNAPAWAVQTQSAKSGMEHNGPNHTPVKVEANASMSLPQMTPVTRDLNTRPFVSQTASGNLPGIQQPLQQMHFVQAPSLPNNHNEIAKIIQKLLQPQPPEHPTWNPPSRDYMSKALTCQICQVTINEVESVLICDACERGYHILCAQSSNQRGIPRGEWHCMRCLSISNGKPLPPKYGRVMRSNIQVKAPSNTAGVQMSSGNRQGALDPKLSQQKITANGKPVFQNPAHTVGGSSNRVGLTLDPKIPDVKGTQGSNFTSSTKNMNEKPVSGSYLLSESSSQPKDTSESSRSDQRPESKAEPPSDLSKKDTDKSDHSQQRLSQPKAEPPADSSNKDIDKCGHSQERLSQPEDTSESTRSDQRPSESKAEPPADLSNKDADKSGHSQERLSQPEDTSESSRSDPRPSDSKSEPPADLSNKDTDKPGRSQERLSQPKDTSESSTSDQSPSESKAEPPADLSNKDTDTSSQSQQRLSQPKDISETSSSDQRPFESKGQPPANNKDTDKSDHSQPSSNPQVMDGAGLPNSAEVPSKKCNDSNYTSKDPDNSHSGGSAGSSLRYDIKQDDQGGAQANTCEISVASGRAPDHSAGSSDGFKSVQWMGDAVQIGDEKLSYHTCCIDGVMYKLQDHALFQSGHGKLIPSKLQSMWEDRKTGSKWITVNKCYFPGDLPENVGHRSTPESNEVYESNHDSTVMAGLIQGPCEVLSPAKFSEESERRGHLGQEANNELRPIFLCKWIYDEFEGSLQPVPQ